MAYDVVPALNALKSLGINAKDWLIKAAKSKTVWFSTALTIMGSVELYMPFLKTMIGDHSYGVMLTAVGVIVGLLRFATTNAISDK
jgi:hypothetical protein